MKPETKRRLPIVVLAIALAALFVLFALVNIIFLLSA